MYPCIHTNKISFILQCREGMLSFNILFNIQETRFVPSKTQNPPNTTVLTLQKAIIELYRT